MAWQSGIGRRLLSLKTVASAAAHTATRRGHCATWPWSSRTDVVMDGVVIELPDAADPAPVVRTFLTDEAVRRWFYVDNVIALVNAARCLEQLDGRGGDPSREGAARAQLALASTVLLSGADLADEAALAECEHRLKELNGAANIVRFQEACVPLERLIDVNAFDHTRNGTFGWPVRGGSRAPGPPCARRRLLYQHFAL